MIANLQRLTLLEPFALVAATRAASTAAFTKFFEKGERVTEDAVQQRIPDHDIEDNLPSVKAQLRSVYGSKYAYKIRKSGRMPAVLDSLPGQDSSLLLHLDAKDGSALVRKYGRNGVLARPLRLDIVNEEGTCLRSTRVLTRNVHVNSQTLSLENLSFLFCPQNRVVKVPVPIKLWNNEIAPGIKKGAWLHQVSRTVTLKCEAWAIPAQLELDMRGMDVNDIIRFVDLQLPPGTTLAVPDPTQPVVRCAAKVGGGD